MFGRKGRIILAIFTIALAAWGTYSMLTDYMMGYPFWWYNSSLMLFGFALLGLLLLVLEGLRAFRNYEDYGLHPEKSPLYGDIPDTEQHPDEHYVDESQRLQRSSDDDDSTSN